jgi:hypothetical protein
MLSNLEKFSSETKAFVQFQFAESQFVTLNVLGGKAALLPVCSLFSR